MRYSVDHEAARWAVTLRDHQASFDDIERALNWIHSTAQRKAAFDRAERFLVACDATTSLPSSRERLFSLTVLPDVTQWVRSWGLPLAAILILLVTVSAYLLVSPVPHQQAAQVRYASIVGEVRTIPLPDGSKVTLGGSSGVTVAFGSATRRITLTDGEAFFDVAKDRKRPFIVAAGNGTIVAVGTAFGVHRKSLGTTVTVAHGVVDVISETSEFLAKRRLHRAMQVSYSSDATMGPVQYVDLRTALGWKQGELNFYDQPLGAVIEDLNRYSTSPITIDDDELRLRPITGAARAEGILEWLRALGKVMNFEVVRYPDRIVLRTSHTVVQGVAASQAQASNKGVTRPPRH